MIDGKPSIFISHSEATKGEVAGPFKEFVDSLGLYGVLVGDEPLPEPSATDPGAKVNHFLDDAQMFVALATADDRTERGEVHTRPNIILEIGAAFERPHLNRRIQIFKAAEVQLPSNINPVYESLDPAHVDQIFATFERQARTWGLLPARPSGVAPAGPAVSEGISTPSGSSQEDGGSFDALLELAAILRGETNKRAATIAARAHLVAFTALAARRSTEPLGVHELNGLYRDRSSVLPESSERQQLLRTVIANVGAANAPGWFWLSDVPASEVRARVSVLAMGDGDARVAREAMNLLAHSSTPPSRSELREVVRSGLKGEHNNGEAALKLLKQHGTLADLRALGTDLDLYANSNAVASARLTVQSRSNVSGAFRTAVGSPDLLNPVIEGNLVAAARSLPEKRVRGALESSTASLRMLALRILNASSRLRKADIEDRVENDDEASVRFLAAELATRRHWRLSDKQFELATKDAPWSADQNQLGVRFVGLKPAAALMESLRWHDVRGYWIYEALGRWHFDLLEDRIEADLDSDFAGLREADRRTFAEAVRIEVEHRLEREQGLAKSDQRKQIGRMVDDALDRYEVDWAKVDKFLLRQFRIAALTALVENPSPRFVRFGRRYLNDSDRETASLAINLLRLCGGDEDVPALKVLCGSSWGDLRVLAAEAALDLARDSKKVALELLAVEDAQVVDIALHGLGAGDLDHEEIEATFSLLDNEQLSIRETAAGYLVERLERPQLAKLLDVYSEGRYFYNVMVRIDRELYAPNWVKESARAIVGGDF